MPCMSRDYKGPRGTLGWSEGDVALRPVKPQSGAADKHAVAFEARSVAIRGRDGIPSVELGDDRANALLTPTGGRGGTGIGAVLNHMSVRRLLPVECEALQGFPRNYTAITYKGKPAADGPRYKALGNSMAVPVMRWIGERIAKMEMLRD